MKKIILFLLAGTLVVTYGCKKDKTTNTNAALSYDSLKTNVLTDFVNVVAVPQYQDLQNSATMLNSAIVTLSINPTDANLAAAQTAWRATRKQWEQCEGFLVGPVEDNNYDPHMDTWPVDFHELDSLLASNNALNVSDIQQLGDRLRGFHPIEYVLWGTDGSKKADSLTARELKYIKSLATDISNLTTQLTNSWVAGGGNFQDEILLAGKGSDLYTTKHDALLAIVGGMTGICEEVGTGKMEDPLVTDHGPDSTLTESPFSHNSVIDFKNNIIGAQNVYLGKYLAQGKSISDLVAVNNISLDNQIKQQFQTTINSFDNITESYEKAIYNQTTQIKATQDELAKLQALLDVQLTAHITQYVTN